MTVNLYPFSGKYAKVAFSSGKTAVIPVEKSRDKEFPYMVLDNFYRADGGPKYGFDWITEVKAPSFPSHYTLQSGENSNTFEKDLAEFLHIEILNDVQNYPDWDDLLRSRIREALFRKLGNVREDLLKGMVQYIAEKARW